MSPTAPSSTTELHVDRKHLQPFTTRAVNLVFYLLIGLSYALGIYLRTASLTTPHSLLFDESHYVVGARHYLGQFWHVHDHPPLGKLLIGIGIHYFGDNSLGWRIIPTTLCLISIPCVVGIVNELSGSIRASLLAGAVYSLDGLFSTFSRIATLDSFILAFTIYSLYSALRAVRTESFISVISAGVFSGFLLAVKFNGAAGLLIVIFTLCSHRLLFFAFIASTTALVTAATTYSIAFSALSHGPILPQFFSWVDFAWQYHTKPMASHRFASQWYSWFLGIKPVWILNRRPSAETVLAVISIPNMLILLGSSLLSARYLAKLLSLLLQRKASFNELRRHSIVLFAIGLNFFPWLLIDRPAFIYHFIPTYILMIIYSMDYLGRMRTMWGNLYLAAALLVAIYFAPLWVPTQIRAEDLEQRLIFRCWKEACPEY